MIDFEKLEAFVEFMENNFPSEELVFDCKTGKFNSHKTQDIFKVWNLTYVEPRRGGAIYS
jgi:hypothetical protein